MEFKELFEALVDDWKYRDRFYKYWDYCGALVAETKEFLNQEICDKIIILKALNEKEIKIGDTLLIRYKPDLYFAGPDLPPKEQIVADIDYKTAEFIFSNSETYPIFDYYYSKKETIIDRLNKKLKESDYIFFKGIRVRTENIHANNGIWSFTYTIGFDTEITVDIDIGKEKDEIFFANAFIE